MQNYAVNKGDIDMDTSTEAVAATLAMAGNSYDTKTDASSFCSNWDKYHKTMENRIDDWVNNKANNTTVKGIAVQKTIAADKKGTAGQIR